MGPKVFFHKIEVGFKPPVRNVFAEGLLASAKEQGFKLTKVDTVDAYALSGLSGLWNLERIAKDVLADPLLQDFSVNEPLALRQG
ncbi:TPA: hypothetical protein HA244_02365, partial [Candidatus Micrarchaeota archaeon]|nr:hypothetical protein [Candidatus Micrarchaeota archaeon]